MEQTSKQTFRLAAASLLLGIAGDRLFQDAAWGINIFIGQAILVVTVALLRQGRDLRPIRPALVMGPPLLAAGGFALRASPTLAWLDGIVLAACVLLSVNYCRTGQWLNTGILGALKSMIQTVAQILAQIFPFLRLDIPQAVQSGATPNARQGLAASRGVLIALPLLLLFGALLSSADPVFGHYMAALFQWDWAAVWERAYGVGIAVCVAGGGLRFLLQTQENADPCEETTPRMTLGRVETAIVLGALDTLFLAFVVVQFRYFFGGRETVLATVGMTYADYARHGFFELVTVAGLTLPLLLALHAVQERQTLHRETLFRGLAGLMLTLIFVIMASALARMNLYCREDGLTELRVYSTAFMGWLAVVLAWFAATVLRGQRFRFAGGAFGSAFFVLLLLFIWNPDARIVRANIALARSGGHFDADYTASLSADSVPALLDGLPALHPADQQTIAARLLQRWPAPTSSDWRDWCWGRWQAQRCIAKNHARLMTWSRIPSPNTPSSVTVRTPANQTTTRIVPLKSK